MDQIKIGDLVQLKSGGAIMTIEDIVEYHEGKPCATCSWFEGKKFSTQKILVSALKHADDSSTISPFF